MTLFTPVFRATLAAVFVGGSGALTAAEAIAWEVPLGGNAYITKADKGREGPQVNAGGLSRWGDADAVCSIFFHVDGAGEIDLALRGKAADGASSIRASAGGKTVDVKFDGAESHETSIGKISVKEAGYVRVDLQGLKKSGRVFGDVESLKVTTPLKLTYVKDNEEKRFYWGRRGPSIHLGYVLPAGKPIDYFYNEVTVPEGSDPIGSYFMSNGFGEGYFGMQVNAENERRVLFSVWSPFHTDDPKSIPAEDQIVMLKKGEGVKTGEFGNEGSGGQSYWQYPWKAGQTYRFLNRVQPDGKGASVYTAWFKAPEMKEWKLIASFKRPKTDKHLTGAHSFLENFSDRNGYFERKARYANQWAKDIDGKWHELTEARFTGDDIAKRAYRVDYAGGTEDGTFFMKNGGFFAESVELGSKFSRRKNPAGEPKIDFKALDGF